MDRWQFQVRRKSVDCVGSTQDRSSWHTIEQDNVQQWTPTGWWWWWTKLFIKINQPVFDLTRNRIQAAGVTWPRTSVCDPPKLTCYPNPFNSDPSCRTIKLLEQVCVWWLFVTNRQPIHLPRQKNRRFNFEDGIRIFVLKCNTQFTAEHD